MQNSIPMWQKEVVHRGPLRFYKNPHGYVVKTDTVHFNVGDIYFNPVIKEYYFVARSSFNFNSIILSIVAKFLKQLNRAVPSVPLSK